MHVPMYKVNDNSIINNDITSVSNHMHDTMTTQYTDSIPVRKSEHTTVVGSTMISEHKQRVLDTKAQPQCADGYHLDREDEDIETVTVGQTDWTVDIEVANKNIKMKIDTRAQCNVLSMRTFKSLGLTQKLQPSDVFIKAYGGSKLKGEGQITLDVK